MFALYGTFSNFISIVTGHDYRDHRDNKIRKYLWKAQDIYFKCTLTITEKLTYSISSNCKHTKYTKDGSTKYCALLIEWIINCSNVLVVFAKCMLLINILKLLYTFWKPFQILLIESRLATVLIRFQNVLYNIYIQSF